jgi:hypothetical protein
MIPMRFSRIFLFWMLASALLLPAPEGRGGGAELRFSEIYESVSVLGMKFSPKALDLNGQRVIMKGFMAPPLKPDLQFFVLTKTPVDICPFCNSDADWPADIVVVYLKGRIKYVQDGTPVAVEGRLEIGPRMDGETGFFSRVRIVEGAIVKP